MPVDLTIVESTTELGQTVVEVVLEGASEPGPAGPGVPTGGTANQVLTKDSATDYDTSWQDAQGGGGGAPTTADYLVGTAQAGLSAEIVVGTTPGGELGGTWASPTVDATHSGSSHAGVQAAAEATAAGALAAHVAADLIDGDAAGGVLSGTYPNPGFAADMATQAELDAHINDTSAAHAASAVSVDSTTLSGTGTDVQALLEELDNLLDDHSARHENGGADEISLAGLDGTPTELTNHLNDTSAAHAASAISVDSTTLVGTGTDVQAVLEELDNGIADHLADTSDAHDASAISFTPAGTIAATDVQAAIEEVASEAGGSSVFLDHEITGSASGIDTNTILGGDIPQTGTHLRLRMQLRATNASAVNLSIRFNNDSSTNYSWQELNATGGGTPSESQSASGGSAEGRIGSCAGSGNSTGRTGWLEIVIFFYRDTTWMRSYVAHGGRSEDDSGEQHFKSAAGHWQNQADAITRIQIIPSAGTTFEVGSRITGQLE